MICTLLVKEKKGLESMNNKIYFKEVPTKRHIKSAFEYINKVGVTHPIIIYYSDTYYVINLNTPHSKIEIYEDFIICFQLENINTNKHENKYPYNGDSSRLIFNKDIKSIEL